MIRTVLLLALSLTGPTTHVRVKYRKIQKVDEPKYEVSAAVPMFVGKSALITFANAALSKNAEMGVHDFIAAYPSDPFEEAASHLPYTYDAKVTITLSESNVISLYSTVNGYTGGAHGMTSFRPHTFAVLKGKAAELRLADLVMPGKAATDRISKNVLAKLSKVEGADLVKSGQVTALTKDQLESFVLGRQGFIFLFAPYDMGPYSAGPFKVFVPYADVDDILRKDGPVTSIIRASD